MPCSVAFVVSAISVIRAAMSWRKGVALQDAVGVWSSDPKDAHGPHHRKKSSSNRLFQRRKSSSSVCRIFSIA